MQRRFGTLMSSISPSVDGKAPHDATLSSPAAKRRQCGEDAGEGALEARRTFFLRTLGRCPDQERQRRIGKPAQTLASKEHQRCGVSVWKGSGPANVFDKVRFNASRIVTFENDRRDPVSRQPSRPSQRPRCRRLALEPIPSLSCPSKRGRRA